MLGRDFGETQRQGGCREESIGQLRPRKTRSRTLGRARVLFFGRVQVGEEERLTPGLASCCPGRVPSTFSGPDRRTAARGGGGSHGRGRQGGDTRPPEPGWEEPQEDGWHLSRQQAGARAGTGTAPLRRAPSPLPAPRGCWVLRSLLGGQRGARALANTWDFRGFHQLMLMSPVALSSPCGFTWHRFQDRGHCPRARLVCTPAQCAVERVCPFF